jgi:hypothetical protein
MTVFSFYPQLYITTYLPKYTLWKALHNVYLGR